jgi:AcrR family transcriptional regulator
MARDERVRRKILDAAIAEVEEHGPTGLRIQQVCDAAGVSAPVVYRHFGDREGLVEEVQVERFIATIRGDAANFETAAANCATREELRHLVKSVISEHLATRRDARWARANILGSAYARESLKERLFATQNEALLPIARAIASAQERGLVRTDLDAESFAVWNFSILNSRIFMENGSALGSLAEWDAITLRAYEELLFGDC